MFRRNGGETQLITIKYYNEHGNGEMNIDIAKFIYNHPIKEFKTLEKTIRTLIESGKTVKDVIEELERLKKLNDADWSKEIFNAYVGYRLKDKEKFIKKADRFIDMVKKYV